MSTQNGTKALYWTETDIRVAVSTVVLVNTGWRQVGIQDGDKTTHQDTIVLNRAKLIETYLELGDPTTSFDAAITFSRHVLSHAYAEF